MSRYDLPASLRRSLGVRQSGLTSGRAVHYSSPTFGAAKRYHERNYSTGARPGSRRANAGLTPDDNAPAPVSRTRHTTKTRSGRRTTEVWSPEAWKSRVASDHI